MVRVQGKKIILPTRVINMVSEVGQKDVETKAYSREDNHY